MTLPTIVFLLALRSGVATASPAFGTLAELRRDLATTPAHDDQKFGEALRKYLFARALEKRPESLDDALVGRIANFTRTDEQKVRVFGVLGGEDSGLGPAEVVDVMMNDAITEYGVRMWASSAFQKLVGSAEPLAAGHVSKRQMQIFGALAGRTESFEDWERLAEMPGGHPDVRAWVSRVMVVDQLDRLRSWRLKMKHWRTVFSYYEPEFHDTAELDRLLETFGDYSRMLFALATTRDWRTRADLQEAALRRVLRPTQGVVRTVLSPTGRTQPPAYLAHLEKLKSRYLDGARPTDCAHLVSAWTTELPRPPKVAAEGRRDLPPGWRLIENRD